MNTYFVVQFEHKSHLNYLYSEVFLWITGSISAGINSPVLLQFNTHKHVATSVVWLLFVINTYIVVSTQV